MRNRLAVRSRLFLATLAVAALPSAWAQDLAKAPFMERLLVTIPDDLKSPGPFHAGVPRRVNVYLSPGLTGFQFGRDLFASTVAFGAGGEGWSPALSPDRSKVAYRAKREKRESIVVGELAGPPYDGVSAPVFSPDGATVAHAATEGKRSFIVVGDKRGPDFGSVGRPVFSPDGRLVAYAAGEGEKAFVMLGDARGPEFGEVSSPAFSPDGTRVAYVARGVGKDAKALVMIGDKQGPAFDKVGELTFRPDGTVAYAAGNGKTMSFIVGDQSGPEFEFIAAPVFSPDGGSLAYATARKTANDCKWTMVLQGVKQTEYSRVGAPVFAPDGKTLAYGAMNAAGMRHGLQLSFLVGGEEHRFKTGFRANLAPPEFLPSPFVAYGTADTQQSIAFSPDARTWAYRIGGSIVIGEKPGTAFDEVGPPVFSPDGTQVGYMARKGRQIWWKVVEAN